MKKIICVSLLVGAATVFTPLAGFSQGLMGLQRKVTQLEKSVSTQQQKISGLQRKIAAVQTAPATGGAAAEDIALLTTGMDTLQQQVTQLTGQDQEREQVVNRLLTDLGTLVSDLRGAVETVQEQQAADIPVDVVETAGSDDAGTENETAAAPDNGSSPLLTLSGSVDMDVWGGHAGNYYNNDDVTVVAEAQLAENVTAAFGVTMVVGGIPAGGGAPADRWVDVAYDGAWLTWQLDPTLSLCVGDVLYQFGGFNYYLLKGKSMITPEMFLRGVQVTKDFGAFSVDAMAGVQDANRTGGYALTLTVPLGAEHALNLYNAASIPQDTASAPLAAGMEYTGTLGNLSLKLDLGINTDAVAEGARASSALLFEPSYAFTDKFSIAAAVYAQDDKGTLMSDFGNLFIYGEPCYSFSDVCAFGLPVEYHDNDKHDDTDEEIWVVPTLYLYPAENAEWWLWGQVVQPLDDGEPGYYAGSEIIYSF